MIGATVSGENGAGGGTGLGEEPRILDWRAYARRLNASESTFQQAFKLFQRGGRAEPGSSLDRPGVRDLASRIAPPTLYAPGVWTRTTEEGEGSAPVWSLEDLERFERAGGRRENAFEPPGGPARRVPARAPASAPEPGPLAGLLDDPYVPLSEREQLVLRKRGWAGGHKATRRDIAEGLGVSEERVRQIEEQALARLREMLR